MYKKIAHLKDHIILCGYGKIGKEVALNLREYKKPFIIIEEIEEKAQEAISQGYLVFQGDVTDEQVLKKCGILCANGLISAVSNDSTNVYLVLTARGWKKQF